MVKIWILIRTTYFENCIFGIKSCFLSQILRLKFFSFACPMQNRPFITLCDLIWMTSWQSVEGQIGKKYNSPLAQVFPRFRKGASSELTFPSQAEPRQGERCVSKKVSGLVMRLSE